MSKVSFGGIQPNPKESKVWLHPHDGLKTYNQKKQVWTGGGSSNDAPTDEPESLYEFVDLGLPSGTLWATCNVGATKPEESGLFFQWGDTQGYKVTLGEETDEEYIYNIVSMEPEIKQFASDFSDYKFYSNDTFTKYNGSDGLTTLELIDDAANIYYSKMKMPTKEECMELVNNTTFAWTDNYNGTNVKGCILTSKVDETKSIFVPAVGSVGDDVAGDIGFSGFFWSSTLFEYDYRSAFFFLSDSSFCDVRGCRSYYGIPVRGVLIK